MDDLGRELMKILRESPFWKVIRNKKEREEMINSAYTNTRVRLDEVCRSNHGN